MDAQRQNIRIFCSVLIAMSWTVVLGMSGCTHAPAPSLIRQVQSTPGNQQSRASHIAHERYEMLKRLKPKFGYLPLFFSGEYSCDIFFPLGRSDRMYLLAVGEGENSMACYQMKGNQERLVYKVFVTYLEPPKGRPIQTASLLDYISNFFDGAFVLKGQVSRYAKHDLAAKRYYVEYSYVPYTNELSVWRISTTGDNGYTTDTAQRSYNLPEKPILFYEQYGLPLAHGELP